MSTVVLFDDERSFVPGFRDDALVVRDVTAAVELFESLSVIDELWLDFVLEWEDTTEALHALAGVEVKRVIFHSSAYGARSLVEHHLRKAGVTAEVEFPEDPRVLHNPRAR